MYRFHANVRPSRLQVVSTRYRRMRNLPGTQGPFAVLVSDALAISEVNARAATNILMTHLHSANIAHAAGLHRSHDLWPAEGIRVPTVERDRRLRIAAAISSQCVSRAKWPVSKKRTSASGMSRLNASAPGGRKNGSFLPHAARNGGLCLRK